MYRRETIHLGRVRKANPADRSFWLTSVAERFEGAGSSALDGTIDADVAIVGGGYTGLWTALRILEHAPETRVVLLEADFCGSGASGRNGGQVHSWFAEIDRLAAVVGVSEAQRLCAASVSAIAELADLQSQGIIDMDLRLDGWLWTASSLAQEGAWDRAVAMTAEAGADRFRPLDGEEIERRTGSSASYLGVVEENAGTVHPAKLAAGLRDLARSRGVTIRESTPVLSIEPGTTCVLRTPSGVVRAAKVVLSANAWLCAIPEIRSRMYVVDSQVVATARIPERLSRIGWNDGASICDSQTQVLYYQRTVDNRVVFGRGSGAVAFAGRIGAHFNRSTDHGRDNIRELHRVYPTLRGVAIDYNWVGPIDCTADHVPAFDRLEGSTNIVYAVGWNGTGIAQTPVGGRILASLVLDRNDEWSGSGLVGLQRRSALPPEPIRYLGAQLVRYAIGRRNEREIENRHTDALTRGLARLMPGAGE